MTKLNEIADKNPFKVPEDYFDNVNREIIAATSGMENEREKRGLYVRMRHVFTLAASVVGFILLSYVAVRILNHEKPSDNLFALDNEEYSTIYINDIDMYTLEQQAASIVSFDEMTDVEDADIIDYLMLEDIDINDIYNQLL